MRSTGCTKLIFYNVSQDFRIGEAIRRSKAQGVTFGWYPTGLNSGHELQGNYLRGVDAFPDMLRPELARMPRIVYEFDSPDLRTGTMYPAMARTFRAVGTQFAAMFAYDMLATASRNLGWQTHYLNLVYTPRKAMSAIIAAEAMRRLPRMQSYGAYPENTRFGDFRVSADENLGELVARDAFLYAGSTHATPPDPAALSRIAGYGSSPTVTYEGEGIYFLDKVRAGVWRLEVYPDAVPVRDPFEPPNADKIVTRAISRSWPMTVALPDLGASSRCSRSPPATVRTNGDGGRFTVTPGVYVLSAAGPVDVDLPARLGELGFAEYHAPPRDSLPPWSSRWPRPRISRGAMPSARPRGRRDSARLGDALHSAAPADSTAPSRCTPQAATSTPPPFRPRRCAKGRTNSWSPSFAAVGDDLPRRLARKPWDWDYYGGASWPLDVVGPQTPLRLFSPGPTPSGSPSPASATRGAAGSSGPVFRGHRPAGLPPRAAGGRERLEPGGLHRLAGDQDRVAAAERTSPARLRSVRLRGLGAASDPARHADGG